jgi:TetR/AcrR family transcriptional regulator, transcriptional repressor of aconitase
MPKVSDQHREERRRQILDGATRAFAEHGYAGATVSVLEGEIGLSRGAIFSYFPTKLDLFVALAQENQERILRLWIDEGYEAVVRDVGRDDAEWPAVYLDVSRMLRNDPELRERWQALNPQLQERLEQQATELRRSGRIRDDLPLETVGRFIGIVLDGLAIQLGAGFGSPVDIEGTLELMRSALAPRGM